MRRPGLLLVSVSALAELTVAAAALRSLALPVADALAMNEPRYPYVALDVAAADVEAAGARLFDLGAQGIEERDATTMVRPARAVAGMATLIASFADEASARDAIAQLPAAWAPRIDAVVGDEWLDEWKKHFEPFRICDSVVIRPPWRTYAPLTGDRVIELEPGRAFGTGLHETTRVVAQELAAELAQGASARQGARVLDVGCGSGVLSLVALALGAESVRAIDLDPDAISVTRENAARNAMESRLHADETPVGALEDQYPLVVANIETHTLVDLAPDIVARLAPGAVLILSGILAHEIAPAQTEDLRRAYSSLETGTVRRMGEWVAMSFHMPIVSGSSRGHRLPSIAPAGPAGPAGPA